MRLFLLILTLFTFTNTSAQLTEEQFPYYELPENPETSLLLGNRRFKR